ncbi:MAG TPA: hypothetical protein VM598_12935 [Bdellovibrionota bacterium]|nr:hypothetical protein [Bdellovibrionota bacterium]
MKKPVSIFAILLSAAPAFAFSPSPALELRASLAAKLIDGARLSPAFNAAYERKVGQYQGIFERARRTQSRMEMTDLLDEIESDLRANPRSTTWVLGKDGVSQARDAITQARAAAARGDLAEAREMLSSAAKLAESFGIDL